MKKIVLTKGKIFCILLGVLLLAAVLVAIHVQTTQVHEDLYSLTGSQVELKGELRSEYYVFLEGESTPIRCSAYEYLYLTNPKMFLSGEDAEKEYLYTIKYKKSVFPFESAEIIVIKDRIEK